MTQEPSSATAEFGVGQRVLRVEDAPLLRGEAMFLDDVKLPANELHAVFVRSQVAHGVLTGVEVDQARAVPGVVGVYTAADLRVGDIVTPLEEGIFQPPRPVLARERVRFVGEPIAVVVAESRYAGEDAAALIGIEIEPLVPVRQAREALSAESPDLFDRPDGDGNVVFDRCVESGDPDAAFEAADYVVERTFTHPRVTAAPMESRGVAAVPEDGGVTLWSSTQYPHNVRRMVRELLGIERVRVRCPDIGGGFGLKGGGFPEEVVAAWLALKIGRPVKWVEDRVENLMASGHARDVEVKVRAAADANGMLTALELDVLCDIGAYGVYPLGHILEPLGVMGMAPGPYRVRNFRGRVRSLATNKCPWAAYRGIGLPVATLVHERVMDVLAVETGIDRAELRRRNMVQPSEMPYVSVTNQRYDSGDYPAALAAALEIVGYSGFDARQREARADGRLLGLGIASYVEWTGSNSKMFKARGMTGMKGFDGCHVELDESGRLSVWTTLPSIGQGTATTFAQLVAAATGIPFRDVRVLQSDTGAGDIDGTGTGASRSMSVGAGAVELACAELQRRLLEDAGERLEVAPDDLEIADGRIGVRGTSRYALDVSQLAAGAEQGRYRVSREFDSEHVLFSYATHACQVSVDPETGDIAILDYVVAEDCGRVVNPVIVEGQTQGAVAQGIGGAMYEAMHYDELGQPQTASFMDYLIPTACELPAVRISHLTTPAPDAVIGSKGVGEGGTIPTAAVLANAVSDALGVECNDLPLTPERVLGLAALGRARLARS